MGSPLCLSISEKLASNAFTSDREMRRKRGATNMFARALLKLSVRDLHKRCVAVEVERSTSS